MTEALAPAAACPRCREAHDLVACPYVKAIDFNEDRTVRRAEFLTPADFGPKVAPSKPAADPSADAYPRLGQLGVV